jgi:competence protein ComEC
VYFIDVGQGDATLIIANGQRLLVDGGRSKDRIEERLQALGVTDLDAIAATHPDADHIAGLIRALELYTVERIYLNGGTSGSQTFADLMTAVNAEGAQVTTIGRGGAIDLGGMTINVLHPAGLTDDSNEDSLVLRFGCGAVDVLITGDATVDSEFSMLFAGLVPDVEVLKVGHHGSNTSTSNAFLESALPEYAVISAGMDNQFGHPHADVVARLAAFGAQLVYTDTSEGDDTMRMTSNCATVDFTVVGDGGGATPAATTTQTATASPTNTPTATATATTVSGTGDVRITDILYDSPIPNETSGEYVELKNFDSHAVQTQGWRIDDEAGTFYTFGSFVLQPGASVRVHNCTGMNSATDLYNGACQAAWNNSGDTASLHNASSALVDTYAY